MKIRSFIIVILLVFAPVLLHSQTAESLYEDAMKEYSNKNFTKSAEFLDKAIALSQGNNFKLQHLYLWRGKCGYYNNEAANKILSYLQSSIQLKKDNSEVYLYLAFVYSGLKNQEAACNYLDLAYSYGYKNDSIAFNNAVSNLKTSKCFYDLLSKYNLKKVDSFIELIKEIVVGKINTWQQKGKFEKTVDYQARVSEETRNIQIQKYTNEVLDSIALSRINLSKAVNEYDADNEAFKITFEGVSSIILQVPVSEAQNFDTYFSKLQYNNPEFTIADNNFHVLHLEIYNSGNDKTYIYNSEDVVAFSPTQLNLNFDDINLSLPDQESRLPSNQESTRNIVNVGKSDVDTNIPVNLKGADNRFALIIGNEDYTKYQTELNSEVNVVYARNDAKVFAEYAVKTLGIPDENIKVLYDAIGSLMKREIDRMIKMAQMTKGEIIIYYAGHGFPDELTKESYIIPVDITGANVRDGIRLGSLYEQLSSEEISKATVFLDACFSGGGRSQGLMAARGVRIKPKEAAAAGNLVVFAATSEDQVSMPYKDKQHGMFTYFLLKKLQETKGELNYKELSDYLNDQVRLNSLKINYKEQSPSLMVSPKYVSLIETIRF